MKAISSKSLTVAVAALLSLSVPLFAAEIDDSIESSARDSYVFKTYHKGDDINDINGVRNVNNRMTIQ